MLRPQVYYHFVHLLIPIVEALVEFYLGTIAMKFEIQWESSGLTDVDDELFDPLIIEEEINEESYKTELDEKLAAEAKESEEDLSAALEKLEFPSHNDLTESNKPSVPTIEGILRADLKGNFWVLDTPNSSNPIYIPPNCVSSAQSGDRVAVVLDLRKDTKRSGKVVSVLPPVNLEQQQQEKQQQAPYEQYQAHQQSPHMSNGHPNVARSHNINVQPYHHHQQQQQQQQHHQKQQQLQRSSPHHTQHHQHLDSGMTTLITCELTIIRSSGKFEIR